MDKVKDSIKNTRRLIEMMTGRSISDERKKSYYKYIVKYPEDMKYIDGFSSYADCAIKKDEVMKHLFHALKKEKKVANFVFIVHNWLDDEYEELQILLFIPERLISFFRPEVYNSEIRPPKESASEEDIDYYLQPLEDIEEEKDDRNKLKMIERLISKWRSEGIMLKEEEIEKDLPLLEEPYIIPSPDKIKIRY